jgi:hypothetical protein
MGDGEADFSVVVTRLIIDGEEPGVVRGSVRWVDAAGLRMQSVKITDYQDRGLPAKEGEGRRIEGVMRVKGEGEQPFVLDLTDVGEPGSGRDTVVLTVGAAARRGNSVSSKGSAYRYHAAGQIVAGDIQVVEFEARA